MKFSVTKSELRRGLSLVKGSLGSTSMNSFIDQIHVQAETTGLVLTTTNLKSAVRAEVESEGSEYGALLFPPELIDLAGRVPADAIDFDCKGGKASIKSGSFSARLSVLDADDFPPMPILDGDSFTVNAACLSRAIAQTSCAASTESSRYEIGCIRFDSVREGELSIVTTDERRMHVSTVPIVSGRIDNSFSVSPESLDAIGGMGGDITVYRESNKVQFRSGGISLLSTMLADAFPAWTKIVPAGIDPCVLTGDKKAILQSVDRVGRLASVDSNSIEVKIDGVEMTLAGEREIGDATCTVPVSFSGEPFKMYINWRFFQDAIQHVEGDVVSVTLFSPRKPIIVQGENPNYRSVICLMKSPEEMDEKAAQL